MAASSGEKGERKDVKCSSCQGERGKKTLSFFPPRNNRGGKKRKGGKKRGESVVVGRVA